MSGDANGSAVIVTRNPERWARGLIRDRAEAVNDDASWLVARAPPPASEAQLVSSPIPCRPERQSAWWPSQRALPLRPDADFRWHASALSSPSVPLLPSSLSACRLQMEPRQP